MVSSFNALFGGISYFRCGGRITGPAPAAVAAIEMLDGGGVTRAEAAAVARIGATVGGVARLEAGIASIGVAPFGDAFSFGVTSLSYVVEPSPLVDWEQRLGVLVEHPTLRRPFCHPTAVKPLL
jgi:hypothetical protein